MKAQKNLKLEIYCIKTTKESTMTSVWDSNERTKICRDISVDSNYNSFGPWNCFDDFSA